MDVERGHIIMMVSALSNKHIIKVFKGPRESLETPQISLPMADEKLNAATNAAPVRGALPIEAV